MTWYNMHPYAINLDERDKIPIYLFLFSIIITIVVFYLLNRLLTNFPLWVNIFFSPPTVFGIYESLYNIFDTYAWNRVPFSIIKTPNLNGKWKGYLKSSNDNFVNKYDCEACIEQTWTNILITFKMPASTSTSLIAGISTLSKTNSSLDYEYLNKPNASSANTLHVHYGFTRLSIVKEKDRWMLNGDYYTGRDRRNFGEIYLEKVVND
jgi:hypothetical protein